MELGVRLSSVPQGTPTQEGFQVSQMHTSGKHAAGRQRACLLGERKRQEREVLPELLTLEEKRRIRKGSAYLSLNSCIHTHTQTHEEGIQKYRICRGKEEP